MKNFKAYDFICVSLAVTLLLESAACGKKDKSKEKVSAAGVEVSSASTVALSGRLNLPPGLTAGGERGLLAFRLVGGAAKGEPQVIPVDAEGNFSVSIDKSLRDLDFVTEQFALPVAERNADELAAAMSRVLGYPVEMIKEFIAQASDAEVQAEFSAELKNQKNSGSVTLLVAYEKSGDKVAEAASFRFIGLPTASGSLLTAIDTQAIRGNLSFGTISAGTGDEASAQLAAGDALNMSAAAQESLASSGKALKSVKNTYMNADWNAGQFFVWQDRLGIAGATDQFSAPSNNYYDGTGFYIGSQTDTPFNYEQICGASAGVVKFSAPVPVAIGGTDNSGNPINTSTVQDFVNTNRREDTQGEERYCLGDNFNARENRDGGGHSFMLNFGRLLNATPEGLWKLSYNDAELARFELGASSPVDASGKPLVYMPSAKFVKVGTKITQVVIEMLKWNGTEYVKESDLSGLKKIISSMNASVSRISDHGENRQTAEYSADNKQMTVTFTEQTDVSDVESYSVYYEIGDSNYRTEYRAR